MITTASTDHGTGLTVKRERRRATELVSACGELDIASAPLLSSALDEALQAAPRRVIVDLNGVGFLDCCGLAALLGARSRAAGACVELKLACEVRSTLRLLALARLEHAFDVSGSLEEALRG